MRSTVVHANVFGDYVGPPLALISLRLFPSSVGGAVNVFVCAVQLPAPCDQSLSPFRVDDAIVNSAIGAVALSPRLPVGRRKAGGSAC